MDHNERQQLALELEQAQQDHAIATYIIQSGQLASKYPAFFDRFLDDLRSTTNDLCYNWPETELSEQLGTSAELLHTLYYVFFFEIARQLRAHDPHLFWMAGPGYDGLSQYPRRLYTLTFYRYR
jgi:hypothetical protein